MPVSIDARPPGVNLTFLRGTARNVPFLFPAGTLAGRTFTATLDAASLSTAIVGDTLTVSVSVAQTNAAANGPLAFVLTETTGVDQPIVVGTWRASTRPQAVTPQQTITVTTNTETIQLQVIGGSQFPELVAGDPTEISLVTAGGTTTLSLLGTIARAVPYRSGEYYLSSYDAATAIALSLNTVYYQPILVRAGTIDSIGIEVTTAAATAIARVGIYSDDTGLPLALIDEANATLDCSTSGLKTTALAAVIPKTGVAWVAVVNQVAAVSVQHCGRGALVPVPTGTSPPGFSATPKSRTEAGISGALPSTTTLGGSASSTGPRIHFRYA